MMDKCGNCKYFIGGGDWNLCCMNPPKNEVSWCGFLCYEDTDSCDNFKLKEENSNESKETSTRC